MYTPYNGISPGLTGAKMTYVFVLESGVRAFPRRDAATAVAKRHETRLNPCRAEAVEEVGLASDLILVEIGVTQLPNIYLIGGGK